MKKKIEKIDRTDRRKKIKAGAALVLVVAGIGYGVWHIGKKDGALPQGGGMPVQTYKVVPQKLADDVFTVGALESSEAIEIKTEIAGKVAEIHFAEGQPVKKGDILLDIDNRNLQQECERTEAAYTLARLTYERKSELRKSGAVPVQIKDEAEAAMREKKAAYEDARISLEKARIMVPFDGIIGLRGISVGDYLEVGDTIAPLVSVDPMKVQFAVPEKYFSALKEGLPIEVTVDAWPDRKFFGNIYAVDPEIDPDTRNIIAKAIFSNAQRDLRPGMFAYIRIQISTRNDALVVPEESLIPQGQQMVVMKVEEGKAKMAPVTVGIRKNAYAEIVSGIKAGDVVITAGHMKVFEGMPVQPMPAAAPGEKK